MSWTDEYLLEVCRCGHSRQDHTWIRETETEPCDVQGCWGVCESFKASCQHPVTVERKDMHISQGKHCHDCGKELE